MAPPIRLKNPLKRSKGILTTNLFSVPDTQAACRRFSVLSLVLSILWKWGEVPCGTVVFKSSYSSFNLVNLRLSISKPTLWVLITTALVGYSWMFLSSRFSSSWLESSASIGGWTWNFETMDVVRRHNTKFDVGCISDDVLSLTKTKYWILTFICLLLPKIVLIPNLPKRNCLV